MRDGRVDVCDSRCGVKNAVTIDTHRHGCVLVGSREGFTKASPWRGVVRRQQGQHPYPPRRAQCSFDGSAVKSAFALLLEKLTKPRFAEKGGNID